MTAEDKINKIKDIVNGLNLDSALTSEDEVLDSMKESPLSEVIEFIETANKTLIKIAEVVKE